MLKSNDKNDYNLGVQLLSHADQYTIWDVLSQLDFQMYFDIRKKLDKENPLWLLNLKKQNENKH